MKFSTRRIFLIVSLLLWMLPRIGDGDTAPTAAARPKPPHRIDALDVRYGDAAGTGNLLDVYRMSDAGKALPLIVWVHGGGWAVGDKKPCPALGMVHRGYVVASINYRLTDVAPYPAQIEDCKGAIRFLRAHAAEYHIDPDRIGVWGAAPGGHLVALLGTSAGSKQIEGTVGGNLDQSSRVEAVCDWFGPTDLSKIGAEAKAAGTMDGTPFLLAFLGGMPAAKMDLVREANPITFITPGHAKSIPPFLIMHGDKDNVVPIAQSQLLADALKKAQVPEKYEIIRGAGHGNGFNRMSIAVELMGFFDRNLKP